MPASDPERLLGQAFASRAEQLREKVFTLFQEPFYFPALLDPRSCVLIGGRGTGKTTVLRGMSYQGRSSLSDLPPEDWDYYGAYIRINTARVTAFHGSGLTDEQWTRIFSHYLNLLLCESAIRFLVWFEEACALDTLSAEACAEVASAAGGEIARERDVAALGACLRRLRTDLELFVNNAADASVPTLSMLGAPLDLLMEELASVPALAGKPFFFLLDEYENLDQTQQRVANTLVKHAGELYSFKIGVKELGWRSRMTLSDHEQLQAPADYAQFDITARLREPGVFRELSARICNDRLEHLSRELHLERRAVDEIFGQLSEDEEAELLNVQLRAAEVRGALKGFAKRELDVFDELPPLYQYLFGFWAIGRPESASDNFRHYLSNRQTWNTRYGNYKHALLYTLRTGRRGIRKHYAGFDTYVELAGGNLRFLLQLVEEGLRKHLRASEGEFGQSWLVRAIPPDTQTRAAATIGERNLRELEGLSLIGPRLTRLCVGLGRVFQIMAASPEGHAPEVTQFRVSDSDGYGFEQGRGIDDPEELLDRGIDARSLIAEAITHLALIRFPGTKLSGTATAEDDYMVHTIFAPVFDYSYRRKRKMSISELELVSLVSSPPGPVIATILGRSGREADVASLPLPDQMRLFDSYLRGDV